MFSYLFFEASLLTIFVGCRYTICPRMIEGAVQKSFSVNLKVMRFFGYFSPQKYNKLYKFYAYAVYCFFIVPIPILASLHLLLKEGVDLAQVSDNAFIICESGCFIIKLLPFVVKQEQVQKSIYMIECAHFSSHTNEQEEIVNESIIICKRNCRLFLWGCCISFVTWTIAPFLVGGYKLPLEIWLPFDKDSLIVYLPSFLYVFAGIGNEAISTGAIDPLLAGLVSHAISQLKILKDNLQFLDEYADEEISKTSRCHCVNERHFLKSDVIYEKIILCINHHNAIENFVKFYEETYTNAVFIQFTASVAVICISCLRLSMVEPFTFTFFAMSVFLCTMLSEIFLYSYYGTILFEESKSLTDAIYMGKWYDYDLKTKKALLLLMERSKRPMALKAGKILDLSLETFTTILKRAYSLLAVLKNFK